MKWIDIARFVEWHVSATGVLWFLFQSPRSPLGSPLPMSAGAAQTSPGHWECDWLSGWQSLWQQRRYDHVFHPKPIVSNWEPWEHGTAPGTEGVLPLPPHPARSRSQPQTYRQVKFGMLSMLLCNSDSGLKGYFWPLFIFSLLSGILLILHWNIFFNILKWDFYFSWSQDLNICWSTNNCVWGFFFLILILRITE